MAAYIHHIATATPRYAYGQRYTRDRIKGLTADPRVCRLIHAIYSRSGIETRHSVCDDFIEGVEPSLYKTNAVGVLVSPTTAERNRRYALEARTLAVEAARQALSPDTGFQPRDITHIIFASCTGFANPGPDYHIIRELGLSESVERYTLGFMGCYAAFPALRMASQFCKANPAANVLVICLELCSLHLQIKDQPDSILANSLFADGAAAAVVSARVPSPGKPAYRLDSFNSALVPSGEAEMAWDIGNEGFNIVLSSYVPEIIGAGLRPLVEQVLAAKGTSLQRIDEWAVHPGGRAILDKVQQSLDLPKEALDASRAVLRDYGNMSSATILFVLKELVDSAETDEGSTCAIAFGPGLTIETAILQRIGRTVPGLCQEHRPMEAEQKAVSGITTEA